ncbi:MAG TPA: PilZ domain-containing protein [Vicinamibacteria bacterium]|jgi:hypothetical protein|nr:PilZ domain-containing protein [Vicinamibacteria bacterium]
MSALQDREKRVALHLRVEVKGQDTRGASFEESTRTLNISGGGVCFESLQKLVVGSRLLLLIQLPPPLRKHFGNRSLYRARAVVCRVEHFEGQAVSRIGARFLGEA